MPEAGQTKLPWASGRLNQIPARAARKYASAVAALQAISPWTSRAARLRIRSTCCESVAHLGFESSPGQAAGLRRSPITGGATFSTSSTVVTPCGDLERTADAQRLHAVAVGLLAQERDVGVGPDQPALRRA